MEYRCNKCGRTFESQVIWAGHLANHNKSERSRSFVDEYIEIKRICVKCGKEYVIKAKRSRRDREKFLYYDTNYCSRSCTNTREHSNETKKKISEKLEIKSSWYKDGRTKQKKFCLDCKKAISWSNKSGYCGKCVANHQSDEKRLKISQSVLKNVENGKHKGWNSRNILSYPENFL